MSGLAAKLASLDRLRRRWSTAVADGVPAAGQAAGTSLTPVTGFGSNPGNLRMFTYVPPGVLPSPALVVVLHGCTQDAAGYNDGTGWSTLADRHGFVLLYPQQSRANNPKACFNWFQPGDVTRGAGECLSIQQMIERAIADHGVDPGRVFVTGLSAGGAMAGALLATYPEVFAAGAIVAGLPYGGASTVQEALDLMFHARPRSPAAWGERVRAACAPYRGPWPRVSVWHGDADATVVPANADEVVKQWADVHGVTPAAGRRDRIDGHERETWRDGAGRDVIERITVAGLAHGTPLACGPGAAQCGRAGPFLLDVGLSSTWYIARFFGLTGDTARTVERRDSGRGPDEPAQPRPPAASILPIDVQSVIQKALETAGLAKRGR